MCVRMCHLCRVSRLWHAFKYTQAENTPSHTHTHTHTQKHAVSLACFLYNSRHHITRRRTAPKSYCRSFNAGFSLLLNCVMKHFCPCESSAELKHPKSTPKCFTLFSCTRLLRHVRSRAFTSVTYVRHFVTGLI